MLLSHQRFRICREAGVGFLERPQDGLFVARQCGVGGGLALPDALLHAAEIERSPLNARSERPDLGGGLAQIAAVGGQVAPAADERHARKQIGDGNADARRGGREIALRADDVRPSPQQQLRRADVVRNRRLRQRSGYRQLAKQCLGRLADQHAEPQDRAGYGLFDVRNRRQRRRQLRLCARDIELRTAARFEPGHGDAQRVALILGIAASDREALLRAAQLEVLASHFGGDAHLHAVDGRLG